MSEILRVAKKEHADKDICTQMKKIGAIFLTHSEVSAQEAVFLLLSWPMLSCTVKCVFAPTNMPWVFTSWTVMMAVVFLLIADFNYVINCL